MRRSKGTSLAAAGVLGALALAACSSSSSSGSSGPAAPSTTYGQANTSVVNPSTHKGGTLVFADSSTPDSTDPGNTYYAAQWNFVRLYTRTLVTFKSAPGTAGLQLVPDLATGLGVVSNNGLTWTYHIQPNIKFEDGTTVTSSDIKYAIERTYAKDVLPNGPSYFQQILADPTYPGPYKDKSANHLGLTSIVTPDATTLVFHLLKPFADFNYVVSLPQTAPVPPAVDQAKATGGANYQLHPVSTGPYMFQSYTLDKQMVLVPNKYWDPATDPNRAQLASKIIMYLNVNANDLDNRLLAGAYNVDYAGTGVQAAARSKILTTPSLKAQADDALSGFLWFTYINLKVIPNVHCRMAIEYAANKVTLQDAFGGTIGGDIASTVMPPNITGYTKFDMYNALSQPTGDITAAKQQLALCGKPNGFSVNMAYRSDRPREVAVESALQQALSQVGIKVSPLGFPSGKYYTDFAGVPNYVHSHNIGLATGGWAADWPNGYGFLYYLTDGVTISPAGNTNIEELNNPQINSLFATASASTDPTAETAIWSQIDKLTMQQAGILPMVYAKSLLYRGPNLTNVYVDSYYGMYNYAVLGVSK